MHCEVWVIPGKQNGIRWMGSVVPHFLPTQRWAQSEGSSAVREWGRCLRKVLCLCGHVVGKEGWIVVYYQFVRYYFSISFTIWAVLVQSTDRTRLFLTEEERHRDRNKGHLICQAGLWLCCWCNALLTVNLKVEMGWDGGRTKLFFSLCVLFPISYFYLRVAWQMGFI